MPWPEVKLDDRTFEDIVREARALIPRYTPEWTDLNDSDPGMTLVQLFAWMAEMIIYRLNQVPEKHYLEFLKLIGVTPRPAEPAMAELTFTLTSSDLETVIVPKGTKVAASADEPIVFETETALTALGAELKEVQVFDGVSFAKRTPANTAPGQSYHAFGPRADRDTALYLGFDSPKPFPASEINLMVYVDTSGLLPLGRHCDLTDREITPPAVLVWEAWKGDQWAPVDVVQDETRAFTRSGHVYLRGVRGAFPKRTLGLVTEEPGLYWLRCRVAEPGYEVPPRIDMVLTNTITARQALTVEHEVLGSSAATPSQSFRLAHAPVLAGTLELEVDEGLGFSRWTEVEDFYGSAPDASHYLLDRGAGTIRFGDGARGRIPLGGARIVARRYRYGGGAAGNVGADKITELQTFIRGVKSVTHLRSAEGGSDEERLADAKLRGPRDLRARDRAVTAEDFALLARETPGMRVRRAETLALYHPEFPDVEVPGSVTVFVLPEWNDPRRPPMPSEGTLATVCRHLNRHRLLTSEVYVAPPRYRQFRVDADVVVSGSADLARARDAVEANLQAFFDPFVGGRERTGWPLGGTVYYSEVFREVLQAAGVARVETLTIYVEGERQPAFADVTIPKDYLVHLAETRLEVRYARSER